MFVIKYRKIFVAISALLVLAGIISISVKGLDYGTEFTGGSVLEISYEAGRPEVEAVKASIANAGFTALVQPFGEKGYVIKTRDLNDLDRQKITAATSIGDAKAQVERFNSIGPSVGKELRTKSLYAIIAVSLGIILFIAYAFRKVAEPVASWKYGIIAVIALLHDLIIPVGILTLMGVEVDTLYVVGLLSILGLSVNDTIVVFDRIRESLDINKSSNLKESFNETIGHAIKDTMVRSLFTSLTLIFVLLALYFVGPVATRNLSLVLLLGMTVGTYSSIFLASPLLTFFVHTKKTAK